MLIKMVFNKREKLVFFIQYTDLLRYKRNKSLSVLLAAGSSQLGHSSQLWQAQFMPIKKAIKTSQMSPLATH